MKLFLSSLAISENSRADFVALVGKPLNEISFALIENAADPYPETSKSFVLETRLNLESLGMKMERIDLPKYINKEVELAEALKRFDVIWIGGGNTYYIRLLMKQTGFDHIIKEILNGGVVYGGGSAGAIVSGETLRHFDLVDDPKYATEVIYEGLGLTRLIVIPHWNTEEIQPQLEQIKAFYNRDGFEVIPIEDGQSVCVNGDNWKIV